MTARPGRQKGKPKAGPKAGAEKSAEPGALVPQKHGGKIWQGAPANPVAGPGRPKDAIRERLGDVLDAEGVDFVRNVVKGRVTFEGICSHCGKSSDGAAPIDIPSIDNRLRAVDTAAKYYLGEKSELTLVSADIQARLIEQVRIVNSRQSWTPQELLQHLSPVWSPEWRPS